MSPSNRPFSSVASFNNPWKGPKKTDALFQHLMFKGDFNAVIPAVDFFVLLN